MARHTPESLANSPRWDDEAERARDEDPAARATPAPPDAPPSTTTERPDTGGAGRPNADPRRVGPTQAGPGSGGGAPAMRRLLPPR